LNHPVLTIASGNKTKVSEISEMLDVLSLRVQKQPEYLNVEETGDTYFEIALLKAKAAALETKTWALADDSGLEVDVLDGRPSKISTSRPESSANAQVFVSNAAAFAFRSAFSKYVFPVSSTFKYSGCFSTLKDKKSNISELLDTFLELPLAIFRTGRFKLTK